MAPIPSPSDPLARILSGSIAWKVTEMQAEARLAVCSCDAPLAPPNEDIAAPGVALRVRRTARRRLGQCRRAAVACVVLLATLVPFEAHAVDINFSFSGPGLGFNAAYNSWGWWAGTVTGTITGLLDNGTSAATNVIITSIPSGMDAYFPATPFSAFVTAVPTNTFTLANGIVTSAALQVSGGYLDINMGDEYNSLGVTGQNVGNTLGFAGVDFAPAADLPTGTAIPEPGSDAILASCLAVLWLVRRRGDVPPAIAAVA